jgi:sensor c-di-GMP phosphodiesterase-like protein
MTRQRRENRLVSFWSRRRRIVLGAIGLVLVVVPVVAVQVVVGLHTRDLARRGAGEIAGDLVSRAEATLDSGLKALSDLSSLGVAACRQSDLDLMRRTVYSNFRIAEVGIARLDGQILCNHIGDAKAVDRLSQFYPSQATDVSLQLVDVAATGKRSLMLLWTFAPDRALTAIVLGDALVANALPRFLEATARISIGLTDGSMIGSVRPRDNAAVGAGEELVSAHVASARYPIEANLSAPLSAFTAQYGSVLAYAPIGSVLLSALVFALFVYILRGPPGALARLNEAVERGEIIPYYQPVVDMGSGRLIGCEVLMRWRKPDGTLVSPEGFIRLAEANSVAWPMTLDLMRHVRADLGEVFGDRPALKIAINLFNAHFARLKTVADVQAVFGGGPIAYTQLVFELTERQPLGDVERARVVIRRLQELGARVALDDAGTGHSGLAYLHQLGVNIVKIDKLFVDTIGDDKAATPIIDSLIKLGHDLGMEVVAEGVETFQQLDYLRAHGADSAQGFLFSPPLPAGPFVELVRAMEPVDAGAAALSRSAEALPARSNVVRIA